LHQNNLKQQQPSEGYKPSQGFNSPTKSKKSRKYATKCKKKPSLRAIARQSQNHPQNPKLKQSKICNQM